MLKIPSLLLIALLPFALGACEGGTVGASGSGVGVGYTTPFRGDLSDIEIRRIGNDSIRFRENQDRAIGNALGHIEASGVQRERIRSVTVDTQGGGSFGNSFVRSAPRFGVWVNIDGCDSSVFYQANPSGSIGRPRDSSGCLTSAKPAAN